MDIKQAVSSIMSTNIKTVFANEPVAKVKDILEEHDIHHAPVVEEDGTLVGIVSSSDLLYFLRALDPESKEAYINDLRLKNYKVEEIMSHLPESISSKDSIEAAIRIFSKNAFHALPVLEEGKLVGILTTHDIIVNLLDE